MPQIIKRLDCYIVATACAALSMSMTISACLSMRSSWIMLGLGVVWEISKMSLAAHGNRLFRAGGWKRIGGIFTLMICAALITGSVGASFSFITTESARYDAPRQDSVIQISGIQSQLASIDQDIGILATIAARDSEEDYRRRSLASLDRISHLRTERASLASGLASIQSEVRSLPVDAFAPVSRVLHLDETAAFALQMWAAIFAAVMLEIIGVVAVLLCSSATKSEPATIITDTGTSSKRKDFFVADAKSEELATKSHLTIVADIVADDVAVSDAPATIQATLPATFVATIPSTEIVAEPEHMATVSDIRDKIDAAKKALSDGEIAPTVRGLGALKIGQRNAQRILDALVDTGTLRKNGRRFVVVKEAVSA